MNIDSILAPYLRRGLIENEEVVHPFHQHLIAMALIDKPPEHEKSVLPVLSANADAALLQGIADMKTLLGITFG
jgi:hypothetical protein